MNIYLERMHTKREELRASAKEILENAAGEDRDVTDQERDTVEAHYREINDLDAKIKPILESEMRQAEYDKTHTALHSTPMVTTSPRSTGALEYYRAKGVGDYLADWGAQHHDPKAAQRIQRARAEFRVVADQKLADNPGIVPIPTVGPVTGDLPSLRPFIDSVTNRPMPQGGSQFNRPRITQHTTVGLQATEKTQLSSQKMTIASVPVTKKTYGGTLDISFQDRDWTDPAILAIAVSDLAGVYAQETDNAAADGMLAATTGTFVLADGAQAGAVRAAFYTAASAIFSATKRRPDTVWMSPDEYAWYAAMTDTGQISFPGLADLLGNGASMLGMRVVVDSNFAAKTTIIGTSQYVEHYETVGGLLSVTEPTILGYTIAYYGYVADLLVEVGSAKKRSAT